MTPEEVLQNNINILTEKMKGIKIQEFSHSHSESCAKAICLLSQEIRELTKQLRSLQLEETIPFKDFIPTINATDAQLLIKEKMDLSNPNFGKTAEGIDMSGTTCICTGTGTGTGTGTSKPPDASTETKE